MLPVPDPEGASEAASVTDTVCPVTPDFRAPPPELGSKDNVLAETTGCPYSGKQGNQGQVWSCQSWSAYDLSKGQSTLPLL